MVILHVVDIVNQLGNGVSVVVSKYLEYENNFSTVGVYNLNNNVQCPKNVISFNYNDYKSISVLNWPFNKPDLVIFNEVYKPKYIKLYKECLKNNIPYIIIPHGCLVDRAQKEKNLKKKIGNILLFNKFIKNASAIQFLNENEKINTNFKYKKSLISGNGIDFPKYTNKYNKNKDIVFIGRYSIKVKGLDLLVETCQKYKQWFIENKIKIKLYGRTAKNDIELLKELILKANVEDIIIVNDAVYGKDKEKILKKAYVFIQLSRHEGEPMGIIEALSVGVPCIITYGTSFGNYVNENKCGIGVNFDAEEVFKAINKMYEDEDTRNEYSNNAINSVNEDYNWNKIIEKLVKEYEAILNDI